MPQLEPYWAAGFSFSRGHFKLRVPYDAYQPMVFQVSAVQCSAVQCSAGEGSGMECSDVHRVDNSNMYSNKHFFSAGRGDQCGDPRLHPRLRLLRAQGLSGVPRVR